jgi:hypothetical protein
MEEEQSENTTVTENVDTRHRPHAHALRRILIGIGAIACIVLGSILWGRWGNDIKEVCFGDGEICSVELPDTTNTN